MTLTLDDLLTPEGVQEVRALFYTPDYFRPDLRAIRVTEEAAGRFARLAEHLRKWGYAPHAIAHYLIRILFALFAEDIDLLPAGLAEAHARLDAAVLAAYGWPEGLGDEEVLARLLALNLERASTNVRSQHEDRGSRMNG